ncbi:glycosyltransferase family 2 protein [Larkinella sp. GY13]|uniref:glycosyltransferase family 2 protein n=1 Tax=Larkinella sp. GY13 TaxID=3453720 RepID=UPI003EED592C
MFSVIVPLFNKDQYIDKCIGSVLAQTYSAFELLIINDGSFDNSVSIVKQFEDSRIILINQVNLGVALARNRGVKEAKFEYIAFLDADDWWEPTFLAELSELVNDYPQAILYGSNYYYVKYGQHQLEKKGLIEGFVSGYIDYISVYGATFCVPINCSFVVVRRNAFMKVGGFRSDLRFGEDFDLWIRLALSGKVAYLNKPLAYSNQDVELSNRAVGGFRLCHPSGHYIFHLAYLRPFEEKSVALKQLLDGLRVRSLLPYYLTEQYSVEVQIILLQVEFSVQPIFYRIIYHAPIGLVRFFFNGKRLGSIFKQAVLHLIR